MESNCKHFMADNFDAARNAGGVLLVDFWASWCGPCRMLGPVIEELADDFAGRAVVGKINVDDCPAIAEKYGIMTIPAVFIFKNGEIVEKMVGLRQKVQLAAALNKYL